MKRDIQMMRALVARHTKLFFKDKLAFFMSLLTPIILLVLFVTFLKNVYISSLRALMPEGLEISQKILDGFTGGWLMSSIMGVTCVTLAFCSNIVMITDKINRNVSDFLITPVKRTVVRLSYFISNFITTFIVCFITMLAGHAYLACVGWYLSAADVGWIVLNMVLCIAFGTLLAGIVETFISTQGGISAVSTLVSSMYGFLCGAYMPISQFGEGIRNFVAFIPGTYSTVLFRNYYMNGVLEELKKTVPGEMISALRDAFDGNLYFFGTRVTTPAMYAIICGSVLVLLCVYLLLVFLRSDKSK